MESLPQRWVLIGKLFAAVSHCPLLCVSQVFEHQDGSKSLKLGDFGLATVVNGPLYTVCGTPTYVAPEIVAETG